jgi:ribosomal protein S17
VRVDRLIKHPKYRRYVRRTSKFMARRNGAAIGDKVRIIETRPLGKKMLARRRDCTEGRKVKGRGRMLDTGY